MIKMFIGSSSKGEDADIEMAYEHSLRENCSEELDIVWMRQSDDPNSYWGCWETHTWPTPFSGFRWGIPEYCNFEGRAIYTDCDMINFKDVKELWETDLEGKPIAARRGTRFGGHEFCVMVIDCALMKDLIIPKARLMKLSESHQRYIYTFSGQSHHMKDLDPKWNVLDGENLKFEEMYQLHFTNMATQPWKPGWYTGVSANHPREDVVKLFHDKVEEAKAAGKTPYQPGKDYATLNEYNIIGR